jgi:phage terminase Nu1 subunit (DNA packaging protein)
VTRYVKTLEEIAHHFGVTRQTVYEWQRSKMPKKTAKGFSVAAIEKWRAERLASAANRQRGAPKSKETTDLQEQKLKAEISKIRQDAIGKKLKNDVACRKLVDADDVSQWIATNFLRIKQRLESLPDEMQVLFPSEYRPEAHDAMERYVFELLTEISGWQRVEI